MNFLDPAGAAAEASFKAFLNTPTGKAMMQQVEDRVRAGVEAAATKNALNLMAFALAGGAIGGTVFKGPFGILAAAGVAAWAGYQLLEGADAGAPAPAVAGLGYWRPRGF